MTTIEEDIEDMKELNRQLKALLDDPHPGLATWMMAVIRVLNGFNAVREGDRRVPLFPDPRRQF